MFFDHNRLRWCIYMLNIRSLIFWSFELIVWASFSQFAVLSLFLFEKTIGICYYDLKFINSALFLFTSQHLSNRPCWACYRWTFRRSIALALSIRQALLPNMWACRWALSYRNANSQSCTCHLLFEMWSAFRIDVPKVIRSPNTNFALVLSYPCCKLRKINFFHFFFIKKTYKLSN